MNDRLIRSLVEICGMVRKGHRSQEAIRYIGQNELAVRKDNVGKWGMDTGVPLFIASAP